MPWGNSTNVVDVYYLMSTGSASYKATIELMAIKANATASDAFSMIRTRANKFPTSVSAIGTLKHMRMYLVQWHKIQRID